MISRLLRFSFSNVSAELWPVPCCYTVTGLLFLRARAGLSERLSCRAGPALLELRTTSPVMA